MVLGGGKRVTQSFVERSIYAVQDLGLEIWPHSEYSHFPKFLQQMNSLWKSVAKQIKNKSIHEKANRGYKIFFLYLSPVKERLPNSELDVEQQDTWIDQEISSTIIIFFSELRKQFASPWFSSNSRTSRISFQGEPRVNHN